MATPQRRYRRYGKSEPYKKVWLKGKAKRAHRVLVETKLGRELKPGEIVHHRDNDGTNDVVDNLEVLPNQRVHMLVHHYQRREAMGIQHLWERDELIAILTQEPRAILK